MLFDCGENGMFFIVNYDSVLNDDLNEELSLSIVTFLHAFLLSFCPFLQSFTLCFVLLRLLEILLTFTGSFDIIDFLNLLTF